MSGKYEGKKILVIDDDEDDFWIIRDYVHAIPGNEFTVEWSFSYEEGLSKLLRHEYDLYLVDYRLGAKTGIDFLKEASLNSSGDPVILLTGKGNYDLDVLSMKLGAADYLVKTELNTEKIERSIRYAIGRASTLKEIRAKEAKYRNLFENSRDVIFVTNHQLRILDINAAIEDTLGYPRQEALNMYLNTLVGNVPSQLQPGIIPGTEYNNLEVEAHTRSGEKRYCILTLNFEDGALKQGNLQGILHDITNLKLIERSRIQNEKLAATGRLLRTIAHEVRNPINNISLAAEQLRSDLQGPQSNEYVQIIERNSMRINALITELLNTSRPSSGYFEHTDLWEVMQDVIAASRDRLSLLHIRMSEHMPETSCMIQADRNNLKLALQNIVMNAIESINHTNGHIEILLNNETRQPILLIRDNGCGIPEDDLVRLFEPFFTQKKNGLGLGLTYSMNILRAHDVLTNVQSDIGKGTTFKLTFQKVVER